MILKPGTIIEEVSNGQLDIRCLILDFKEHRTVYGLGTYKLYVIYSAHDPALPNETIKVRNTLVESRNPLYHWRIT